MSNEKLAMSNGCCLRALSLLHDGRGNRKQRARAKALRGLKYEVL